MSINYEDRVYDLADFCSANYGLDPLHLRIICSCLLPCRVPPVWLICDSPNHVFWEHLSGAIKAVRKGFPVMNLAWLRVTYPRIGNIHIKKLMEGRKEKPLIYFDRMGHTYTRKPHPRHMYHDFVEECLRVRVPLSTLLIPQEDAEYELARLLRLAINPEFREEKPGPVQPNDALMCYARLMQMMNPELASGSAFIRNVCLLPEAHRSLMGRSRLTDEDWLTAYHVMMGTVRVWDQKILRAFAENDGYMDLEQLRIETLLSRRGLVQACGRLHEQGILWWPRKVGKQGSRRRWIGVRDEIRTDVLEFVTGRARWWR